MTAGKLQPGGIRPQGKYSCYIDPGFKPSLIAPKQHHKFVGVLGFFQVLPKQNIEKQKGCMLVVLLKRHACRRTGSGLRKRRHGGDRRYDEKNKIDQQNPGYELIFVHLGHGHTIT